MLWAAVKGDRGEHAQLGLARLVAHPAGHQNPARWLCWATHQGVLIALWLV